MVVNSATSQLWIVNPFRHGGFANLFSIHLPVELRVVVLFSSVYQLSLVCSTVCKFQAVVYSFQSCVFRGNEIKLKLGLFKRDVH